MTDELAGRLQGISHLALNSSDMARTVDFYTKLGFPLVKTMDLPAYHFQHFFFDIGNGDCLAYFWYDDERGVPGHAGQEMFDGAMNHVAIQVPAEDLEAWWDRLEQAGITFGFAAHGVPSDDGQITDKIGNLEDIGPDTFAGSLYFSDPDGAQIELTAWLPAWDRIRGGHVGRGTKLDARRVSREPYMTALTAPRTAPRSIKA